MHVDCLGLKRMILCKGEEDDFPTMVLQCA